MMHWRCRSAVVLILLSLAHFSKADSPPSVSKSLFDPAKHMRVSEVHPGMKGYGVSVFYGTKLERFDVEVVSILKNFNPKTDVVLIRCHGANLEHTGAIAGMSGSPIYLTDDTGKSRMIGAFAYGWPLQKDPIAGVQPIEYMLELPVTYSNPPATQPVDGHAELPVRAARWSLSESVLLPGMKRAPANYPFARLGSFEPNPRLLSGGDASLRLTPLSTPLMASGMPPSVLKLLQPAFSAYNLVPLQAGGGSGDVNVDPKMEPGSVIAVPLLTGDVDMSAVGTTTEVVGDKVVAFGHSFNSEGQVALPFGNGSIQGIIASYMTSFKLGAMSKVQGTLTGDTTVGITGALGKAPDTIPIDLRIQYLDGSADLKYHFNAAAHPKLTPLIAAAALASTISGARELPEFHTLNYDLTIDFANGKSTHITNTAVNATAADLFFDIGTPMMAASENPFQHVMVKKITGTFQVSPQAMLGQILYANVPRSKYRPGETVTAYVTYRPFRAAEAVLPISLELPRDLPDGTYQFSISDWQKYLTDEQAAEPFKFTAENIDQVFDVIRDVAGIRHNAIYARLLRQPDGVAIGHTAMPRLPSSRRQIMVGSGRSDTTQFVSSAIKIVPTTSVMSGSAEFEITIDKNASGESTGTQVRPPHRDVRPQPQPKPMEVEQAIPPKE